MYQLTTRRGDSFNSLVDELFSDFFNRTNVPTRQAHTPTVSRARLDVLDKGGNFEIKVDLPGIRKDDINVGIEGARVSINAESKDSTETKDKTNGDRILYSERYSTSYARSFELPAEVTEEGADARFEDGVLTLSLPKRAATVSKRIAVK